MTWSIAGLIDYTHKEEAEYKANIGRTVVIGKDTFVVTSYSMLSNEYVLSNGTKVDKDFIKPIQP